MVFPVVGGDGKPTGYEIENSGRFDNAGGSALGGTFGTATNEKKFTLSMWYKKSSGTTSGGQVLFGARSGYENIFLHEETMRMDWNNASSGTINWAPFIRDHSAWYHFVLAQDTTQSTDSNRIKFYINGVQITTLRSGVTATYPSQNLATGYNVNGQPFYVSSYNGSAAEINGYLANVQFVDGQQYDPTYFGKFDDNGVWIPVEPGTGDGGTVDYGNNGFLLEFKQTGTGTNSSGIGADTSGNDNHLSVTGLAAQDITTDTPTNNFCTMNPLMSFAGASDGIDHFREGHTVVDSNNDTSAAGSTFGVQNGKWYYEAKLTTGDQSSTNFSTGWCQVDYEGQKGTGNGVGFMSGEDNASMDVGGNIIFNNSGSGNQATFGNRSTNDIFQVAVDLDNNKMWFGVNGTWSNGSASQSTTFDASNSDFSSIFDTAGVDYMPAFAQSSSGQTVLAYNFGNPSYSISSGNADANGYGNFEYAVPSGFYSLCTKNLAQYG